MKKKIIILVSLVISIIITLIFLKYFLTYFLVFLQYFKENNSQIILSDIKQFLFYSILGIANIIILLLLIIICLKFNNCFNINTSEIKEKKKQLKIQKYENKIKELKED